MHKIIKALLIALLIVFLFFGLAVFVILHPAITAVLLFITIVFGMVYAALD